MLNYQKAEVFEKTIDNFSVLDKEKVKIKDVIKFNLGVAYFIVLCFFLIKLLFT